MKRPRPENTSAPLIIVPYARPASEIPISAPRFWPGVQKTRKRTRFAAPIDHTHTHTHTHTHRLTTHTCTHTLAIAPQQHTKLARACSSSNSSDGNNSKSAYSFERGCLLSVTVNQFFLGGVVTIIPVK